MDSVTIQQVLDKLNEIIKILERGKQEKDRSYENNLTTELQEVHMSKIARVLLLLGVLAFTVGCHDDDTTKPAPKVKAPDTTVSIPDATPKPNTPNTCLLYTSPSPRDRQKSRMPSSA